MKFSLVASAKAATLAALLCTFAAANSSAETRPLADPEATGVYVQVILYHGTNETVSELRDVLTSKKRANQLRGMRGFLNERVLESFDELSHVFATYAKFSNPNTAERYLEAQLTAVDGLTRRQPEHHLVTLEKSFMPGNVLEQPSGMDFGVGQVGQNAHLGLFVPQPDYAVEYFNALSRVKEIHVERDPKGWLGDELASSFEVMSPDQMAPNSPRPWRDSVVSINYGEYDTFQNAEAAYLNVADSGNPDVIALEEIFYGALQVPSRYFIFVVVGNTQ